MYLFFLFYHLMAYVYGLNKVFYTREIITHVLQILPCRFPPPMMSSNCQKSFLTLLCDGEARSVLLVWRIRQAQDGLLTAVEAAAEQQIV